MRYRSLLALLLFLCTVLLVCSCTAGEQTGTPVCSADSRTVQQIAPQMLFVETTYKNDLLMWKHLVGSEPAAEFKTQPAGIILPHHAMVGREIGRMWAGVAQTISPRTIFILCPNHFETSPAEVVTAYNCSWNTVFGTVETERNLCMKLADEGLAVIHDASFTPEHGIFIHAPFIKYHFPDAKIVPILFRWHNDRNTNNRIAEWLNEKAGPESLIVASVDFSHYQPVEVADLHDQKSYSSIMNFLPDAVYDCEIDSPSSIYTLMKVMEKRGNQNVERVMHTNSDRIVKLRQAETTSHQYFAFYPGKPEPVSSISIMIGGSQSDNFDHIQTRQNWSWDRNAVINPETDPLALLRGKEDRFFMGTDLCLFTLPGNKKIFRYTMANGTVSVIRINTRTISQLNSLLQKERIHHEYVVVLYETDTDDYAQVKNHLVNSLNTGAAAVIRRGPGAVGVEYVNNRPLVYGLGELTGAPHGDTSALAALTLYPDSSVLQLLPLISVHGKPQFDAVFDPVPD